MEIYILNGIVTLQLPKGIVGKFPWYNDYV